MSCPCKKAVNIFDSASTPYCIGKTGENVYQEIEFNFSKWLSEYPDAKIDLLIRAPKNGYYLLAEGITEPTYLWKPSAFDLANPGRATVMARMSSGEVRAKSDPVPFEIVRSMDYNLDISERGPTRPSLMDEWIEDIYEAAARYPKVGEDNYWYVWDVVEGDWKKTDTYAGGTEGKGSIVYVTVDADNHVSMSASEIIAAVDDGKFPILELFGIYIPYSAADDQEFKPVFAKTALFTNGDGTQTAQTAQITVNEDKTWSWETVESPTKTSELTNDSGFVTAQQAAAAAPVQSVNGMTGAVTIPTGSSDAVLYTAQSLTDAQKTQARTNVGAGTYSKPASGIPASDLASGVIPVVPQMATDPDFNDWTSGKTVDAGLMASVIDVFIRALSSKANASDIPTAVSELTNDSGYQTAQDVQTAIAGVRQLPAVTASDNGKFLRVVNDAWAAETVQTWQGGSY